MPFDTKAGFVGLVTNVAETQAPAGALRVANNVVIRKPGAVEARPGAHAYALGWTPSSTTKFRRMWSFDGADYAYTHDGTNTKWYKLTSGSAFQYTKPDASVVDPEPFRVDLIPAATARGTNYIGTQLGVLKILDAADTSFSQAGLFHGAAIVDVAVDAGGTWLGNNERVAYRTVHKRTDANGLVTRSVPSGRQVRSNTSGSSKGLLVTLLLSDQFDVDTDEIEVYRTLNFSTTTTIDDNYYLAKVLTLGDDNFVDTVAASDLGAALYTNSGQDGIEGANSRPPACGAMELFRGSLFFGNTIGPFRKTISFDWAGTIATATGIGIRTVTGETTITSPVVIGLSSTTGLQAGMVVNSSRFAANVHIISVDSATQVTLSGNASASGAAHAMSFYDSILIDGRWVPIAAESSFSITLASFIQNTLLSWHAPLETFFANNVTPAEPGYDFTVLIEEALRSSAATSKVIKATHGDEYYPPLPLYANDGLAMDRDVFPGALYWSKTDEPEHVGLASYTFIGDKSKAILALASTRDSMFVFKEDGIWRLSGTSAAGGWRIDPFDMTTFVTLPSSVVKLNNRIYALTNKGFVTVSEGGVKIISAPIANEARFLADVIKQRTLAAGYCTQLAGTEGYAAAVNERESEYVFVIPDPANLLDQALEGVTRRSTLNGGTYTPSSAVLVFNESTQAWTTWTFYSQGTAGLTACSAAWSDGLGTLLIGGTTGVVKRLSRLNDEQSAFSMRARWDDETEIAVSDIVDSVVTYTPAHAPMIDDLFVDDSGNAWPVIGVDSPQFTIQESAGATAVDGTGYLYRTVVCDVQPHAFTQPILANKRWKRLHVGFGRLVGAISVSHRAVSSEILQESQGSEEYLDSGVNSTTTTSRYSGSGDVTQYHYGKSFRHILTRDSRRAWLRRSRVRWIMAFGEASLELIASEYDITEPGKPSVEGTG